MGFEAFAGARTIAVVGASERNLLARITVGNLLGRGFPGRVVGVHPRGEDALGIPVAPSLEEAGRVDLAILCVGAGNLVAAVREAAGAGVPALILPGAGGNEGGNAIAADLEAAVGDAGIDVIGPNCMGFASLHEGVVPYVGTLDRDLQAGEVALVSQSGSVCELFTALPWRVGLSHIVSVGNELSLDATDVLEFLIHDDRTRAIGLFLEGIRRPPEFRDVLRRAAEAGKPVVALKVGRSETARIGAEAHTGVLAGDARVFSAVLREAGAIEVTDLDALLVSLELLGKRLERPTRRVVYVGDSGGQANLFADRAEDAGIELPPLRAPTQNALRERFPTIEPAANPLDLWALGDPDSTYRDGLALVTEGEPHLVVFGADKFLARSKPERAFVRAGVEAVRPPGAVVLMAFAGGEEADPDILRACWERRIPVVRGAERTLAALAALDTWERRGAVTSSRIVPAPVPGPPAGEAWDERRATEWFAAAGVPMARHLEARSPDEAVAVARELGLPVVVKASAPDLSHKTEAGGVRIGLTDVDAVAAAATGMLRWASRVLVAEERTGDLELIAGAFDDPQFGPCGLLGLGGLWTEALGEAVVVAGPGTKEGVRRALATTGWGRLLLEGARGRRFPVDRIAKVCLKLMDLLAAHRDQVSALEVNPLFVEADDVVAVDALAVPRAAT
jgi:acyl-CoA synthetase (NDP forming)